MRAVSALDLSKRGIIAFEFEKDPTLLEVHVFQATKYTGSPTETGTHCDMVLSR